MIFRLYDVYNKHEKINIGYQTREKLQILSQEFEEFCCLLYAQKILFQTQILKFGGGYQSLSEITNLFNIKLILRWCFFQLVKAKESHTLKLNILAFFVFKK